MITPFFNERAMCSLGKEHIKITIIIMNKAIRTFIYQLGIGTSVNFERHLVFFVLSLYFFYNTFVFTKTSYIWCEQHK